MSNRPLSPHISIYRWPITMIVSILHRATGIAMAIGLLVLIGWIFAAAAGEAAYGQLHALLATPVGTLLLIGWSFAFFLHLGNGIRHLVWDTGRGFEKSQANASAWLILVLAFLLTAAYWWVRL